MKDIEDIVKSVISGKYSLVTDVVPTCQDSLSAHIILDNYLTSDFFVEEYPKTSNWIAKIQENHNWRNVLGDLLYLTHNA